MKARCIEGLRVVVNDMLDKFSLALYVVADLKYLCVVHSLIECYLHMVDVTSSNPRRGFR